MDQLSIYAAYTQGLFTDLVLILNNSITLSQNGQVMLEASVTINVHRIILYSCCLYFQKLLTAPKEREEKQISITVPNANIVHDIIMSFYGQKTNKGNYPQWLHVIETIKCRDYLCMDNSLEELAYAAIPAIGYDSLFDIAALFNYNSQIMRILSKNLPKRYDVKKISHEFKAKIGTLSSYCYYLVNEGKLKCHDLETGAVLHPVVSLADDDDSGILSTDGTLWVTRSCNEDGTFCLKIYHTYGLYVRSVGQCPNKLDDYFKLSHHNKYVAALCHHTLYVWTIQGKEQLCYTYNDTIPYLVDFLMNENHIAIQEDNEIRIFDIPHNQIIKTIRIDGLDHLPAVAEIIYIQNETFLTYDNDLTTIIMNMNGEIVWIINFSIPISQDQVSLPSWHSGKIAGHFTEDLNISVADINSKKIIAKLDSSILEDAMYFRWTTDDKYIIIIYPTEIKIWDYVTNTIIKQVPLIEDSGNRFYRCLLPDK